MPRALSIAMLSLHSSPLGELGTRDTGGMSVYIRELAEELGRRGHGIDIFTQQPGGMAAVIPLAQNVRLIHVETFSKKFIDKTQLSDHLPALCNAVESFRHSEKRNYHLIHSHYWLSGMAGLLLRKEWHCPHITMFHTLGAVKNATRFSENEPLERIRGEQTIVRRCNHIIAPTAGEKEALIRHCGASENMISVIPCGVDLSLFQPEDCQSARTELGVSSDAPILLYAGRFVPVKGLENLLQTIPHLKQSYPNICLMLVGGDNPESQNTLKMKKTVQTLKLTDDVVFTGRVPQSELPRYYSAADVTVFPSHYESFGLTPLESLACGTPVAATPVGCIPDVIRNGVNGWICPDTRPKNLARTIQMILHQKQVGLNPEEIRKSVTEYGWDRVAIRMESAYNKLIGNDG